MNLLDGNFLTVFCVLLIWTIFVICKTKSYA